MIRMLRRYLRPYAWPIAGVLVLLLVQAIGNLYLPTLNGDIINEGVSKGDTDYILRIGGLMTPTFSALRIEGSGDTYTYVGTYRYGSGDVWQVIAIVQLRDRKLARSTSWYAAPFDAPEWRAGFVERFPGLGS